MQSNLLAWAPDFKSDPSELSVSGPKQVRWRAPCCGREEERCGDHHDHRAVFVWVSGGIPKMWIHEAEYSGFRVDGTIPKRCYKIYEV